MKKHWFYVILLLLPLVANAQNITTISGNGNGGDGTPAISAHVYDPCGLVFDKYGNLYFATNLDNRVRKIDTSGVISTIAGTGSAGFNGDSIPAITAELNQPVNLAIDTAGNIYIADAANNRIRKITMATGIITTVAGNGIGTFSGDNGIATSASLYGPSSICFDGHGNMYIADYANGRLRKVNTSGVITTIAGTGVAGWSGDGGLATTAKCIPIDVRTDNSDNIFIVNWGTGSTSGGGGVRKINTSGVISTIAGDTASYVYNGDEILATHANMNPQFITLDNNGIVYLSDYTNNRIRKVGPDGIIHTVVGNGIAGNTGDNSLATMAEIYYPSGLVFDSCGNLYFGQVGIPRIRKVTFYNSCFPESIREVNALGDVKIYPNPAYDNVTISGGKTINDIAVINVVGQTVIKQNSNSNNIVLNVEGLQSGVYFIKVSDRNGGVVTRRFVKE